MQSPKTDVVTPMYKSARLNVVILAVALPLVLSACTTGGSIGRPGGEGGEQGSTPSTSGGSSSPSSNPAGTPNTSDSGSNQPSQTGSQSGVPGSSDGSRSGQRDGTQTDGAEGTSDVRVATADQSRTGSSSSGASESDVGGAEGTISDEPEVGVAEALEGANAAVDAAAEAVSEAEATIARAREIESDSAGSGDEDSFDPWMKPSASEESPTEESGDGGSQAAQSSEPASTGGDNDEDEENFDPFANYGDETSASGKSGGKASSASLQIADDSVAVARAALNRARRALITAAGASTGDTDADAEAVQLAAARAAMEAAAEAVIASAIAVMAASDVFDPQDVDPNDAAAAEEALAEGIATVVSVMQRDMRNAGEALEATGELLAAAGALMGMLGTTDQKDDGDGSESAEERVANLEAELDRSLTVFDDRMQVEGSTVATGVSSEDSELAGVTEGSGVTDPRGNPNGGGGARRENVEWNNPRYQPPASTAKNDSEFEDLSDDTVGRPQDDDIVARQLREAAMAESDPELREALWQEYRNYKESLETGEAEAN